METIRIPRTGLPDLEFVGRQVAVAHGDDADGAAQGRRHQIKVYRAEDGEYIIGIDFITSRPGETPDHFVETAQTLDDVDAALSLYDPTERIAPPQPETNAKERQAMLSALTKRYDMQVHSVLSQLQREEVATR